VVKIPSVRGICTLAEHVVTASTCITCSEGSLFVGELFALFGLSVYLN